MSNKFPSLAEVVRKHRLVEYMLSDDPWATRYACECGWQSTEMAATNTAHPEHVEQMWLEARTIRTVEQLDVLPHESIIKRDQPRSVPLYKLGHMWSFGSHLISGDQLAQHLPALLLWHPDWSAS